MQNQWNPDDQETLANNRLVNDQRTKTNNRPVFGATEKDSQRPTAPTLLNNPPVTASPYVSNVRPPPPPALQPESAARERMRRRHVSGRNRGGEWAWIVIAVTLFSVVVVISMSVFVLLRASQANEEIVPTAAVILPTPVDSGSVLNAQGTPINGQQFTLADGRSITLTAR